MATAVSISKCPDYESGNLKQSLETLFSSLGGIEKFVKPGDRVLLKPNLLTSALPEQAVTTHPSLVKEIGKCVLDAGGKPFISDSPAVKGFQKVAKDCGMEAVAKELGIPILPFKESVEHKTLTDGAAGKRVFHILEVAEEALEADRIINIPKLKTHSMMLLTIAVKNIFGCVVGKRKGQWHLQAGADRQFFARLLVELYDAISPDLSIVDAVLAMEGDGPGTSGTPRHCGFISAGADAVALDRAMLEILGVKPSEMFTHQAARIAGIGETELERINIIGDDIEELKVPDFKTPRIVGVFPAPNFIKEKLTHYVTSRPVEDRKLCTLCSQCIDICPTKIISSDGEKLSFDYDGCIRCFCCVEVCPESAMKPFSPILARIVKML